VKADALDEASRAVSARGQLRQFLSQRANSLRPGARRPGSLAGIARYNSRMPRPLVINAEIVIPAAELRASFVRSAGPGGQNVNKVSSKAVLHWQVVATLSLPEAVRRRFVERYGNRINGEGELVIAADEHREQSRNLSAAYERLRQMVVSVLKPPRRRVKTRPSRGSVERRIESKRRDSEKKQRRRAPPDA
jgi:ribosome-associated protein